ncbi:hypothetical protein IID22_00135 [Patescibacteria group bacterium]|nr:hypothetical protein [Patescibacteria group bacterium]
MEIFRRYSSKKIDVSKRQWAVAVGTAVRDILSVKYGMEPSPELIESFVEEIKDHPDRRFLFRNATGLIVQEFEDTVRDKSWGGFIVTKNTRRKARRVIKARYQEIEKDAERNFAYLDPLVITD